MADSPKTISDLVAARSAIFVNELWANYQTITSERRQKLLDWYKQYRGIPNRRNYQGRANVFVNETLAAVESIVAQEVHTIFAEPRYLLLLGREQTDEGRARLLEGAMLYYLDAINWKSKFIRSDRQKVKYGTCFVELSWEAQEGLVPRRVPDSPMPKVTKEYVRDHPQVTYVDELDIALDPGRADIPDMDWVIIRKRMTWDDIKSRERNMVYSSAQVAKITRKKSKGQEYFGSKEQRLSSAGFNMAGMNTIDEYEILRYWGKVPRYWVDENVDVNSEEAEEMVPGVIEVCADKGPTLRLERNPFWHQEIPVAMGKHISVDDEAAGIGVCEISESMQMELNDKRNQLLDHATDNICPPLVENRGADIKEIRWEPQFRIKSNLSADQALKPLYPGGNPAEVVMMEERVQRDIRHKSGAVDPIQGIQSNKESTAFEVSQLQTRGSSRIDLYTIDMGDQFLKRVYRLIYKMIQQFTDKEKMIRILGKDGVKWEKLTPKDVALDCDIIPKIPTDVDNRIIIRNQMIQFLGQVAPFFPRINAYKLVRRIYELFGFDDVEEVVPRPPSEFDHMELTTEEELQVLFLGQRIAVQAEDNHAQKLKSLIEFMAQFESSMSKEAVEAFKDKIRQHMHFLQAIASLQGSVAPSAPPGAGGKSNGANPASPGMTETLRAVGTAGSPSR